MAFHDFTSRINSALIRAALLLAFLLQGCSSSESSTELSTQSSGMPAERSSIAVQSSVYSVSSSEASQSVVSSVSLPMASSQQVTSSSMASSQGGGNLAYDGTFCGDFALAPTEITHSIYQFDTPASDCFGVINDGALKKSLPIANDAEVSGEPLQFSGPVKIVNSHDHTKAGGQTLRLFPTDDDGWSFLTINITNLSDDVQCFVRAEDQYFDVYNEAGDKLIEIPVSSFLDGANFEVGLNSVATNTCLTAGQTLPYVVEFDRIDDEIYRRVSYVVAPRLTSLASAEYSVMPSPAITGLNIDGRSVSARFVNDSQQAVTLRSSHMIFFDEEGYAVGASLLEAEMPEGNALQLSQVESGDVFFMSDSNLYIRVYRPATARRAMLYLKWKLEL